MDNAIKPATLVGAYELLEVIHKGKGTVIYRAHDAWYDRTVAIKFLTEELLHDVIALQRFNHTAKALGNIEHPNVLQAYDFGVTPETEQVFLVTEFLEGPNLEHLIQSERPLPERRLINIFAQVADGMHASHAKGILHRDLKPSHIVISKASDSEEFPKVVDFRLCAMKKTNEPVLPANVVPAGMVVGTPFYMSPEQWIGRDVGRRADIYSLGCTMYECAVGKPPFEATEPLETMYKHLNEQPKPPRQCGAQISARFESIILRCLEKDRTLRYESMSELREELLK
jgi:serine/threonine protein kinase